MQTERESIVTYIQNRAQRHRDAATPNGKDSSYHKGTAILLDALAGDIKAGLDQA